MFYLFYSVIIVLCRESEIKMGYISSYYCNGTHLQKFRRQQSDWLILKLPEQKPE